MENSKLVKKKKKFEKTVLLVAIIFFIIAAVMIGWAGNIQEEELPEPRNMHSVIVFDSNKENVYAKIDAQLLTDCFASYGEGNSNDEKYYFVDDKDGYYYIVCLTDETFKKMENLYNYTYTEGAELPESITITGITKSITPELRKIAIDSYGEIFSDDNVNEENFENYYGTVFLKEGEDPREPDMQYIFAFLALVFFLIAIIEYLIIKIKTKKGMKKLKNSEDYDRIEAEMESDEKDEFLKVGTVLTKNYVVDGSFGFKAIKYTDIDWVYPFEFKQYGITTNRRIIVYTKDKKMHNIAMSDAISKKGRNEFDEIYNKLREKAPNAAFGYTKENIEKFKGKRLI